jgi:inner membrane protein
VLDSYIHLSGEPLTMASAIPLALLVKKAIYYCAVGFGALLPDIDNARSIMGRKFGIISKTIQSIAGHRTVFHSLLGLLLGSLLAIGLEQVTIWLLALRGWAIPAELVSGSHIVFFAVLFGCMVHIAADALTTGGVPLLWPIRKRFGFPPYRRWRFNTGSWQEAVIVWGFMILVGIGIYFSLLKV